MSEEDQFLSSGGSGDGGNSAAVTISTNVMVATVIFLFLVVVLVFFLYLYARRYLGPNLSRRGSRRFTVFGAADVGQFSGSGLDAAVIQALPVDVFAKAEFKEGLECAVCLSEVVNGEKVRLLPKCNHGFHVECIDMWFQSHSTCPLCRCSVGPQPAGNPNSVEEPAQNPLSETAVAMPAFPTNILFWGSQDQVNARNLAAVVALPTVAAGNGSQSGSSDSSSSRKYGGDLMIEIPTRMQEEAPSPMSPLPPSSLPMEEMKSPPAISSRFRSLTRLLSRGKRSVGTSHSPRVGDIEQGLEGNGETLAGGSARTPKTPIE